VNMLNKQSWTADKGGPPAWGLGKSLTTPHHEDQLVKKCYTGPWIACSCEHGSELPGSMKGREFIDWLSDH